MPSIRRQARPRDPPGFSAPVADPHTSFPRLPHRSRRSVPRPPPAPSSSIPPSLGAVDSSLRPRMTDTWPLPCMNKSGLSGHLPKAMPGQLITVNHPPATYESWGAKTRQPASKRNGQGYGKRSMLPTVTTSPTLLASRHATPELKSTAVTATSGYRRECPRVECGQADDLPQNLVAHTLALDARTASRQLFGHRAPSLTEQQSRPEAICHSASTAAQSPTQHRPREPVVCPW